MRRGIFISTLLLAGTALAYVLPSYAVLRRMAEARVRERAAYRLRATYLFSGDAAPEAATALRVPLVGAELRVDGSVLLKPPGRCRFQLQGSPGISVASAYANGRVRAEGGRVSALETALENACGLLTESKAVLDRRLGELGVDVRQTSLARFGGQVAYLLGNPAEGKPQFWVYKDLFQPARLRYAASGQSMDVRFYDYASGAGEAFPRVLELWKADAAQLRLTVIGAESRTELSDKLF